MSDAIKDAVIASLRQYLSAEHNEAVLAPDTPLGTLGINSLQLVELVYELEVRFGLQVDEEQLVRLQTLGDLEAMFATARQDDVGPEYEP